jgi:Glycosyl hydrolase 108
MRGNFDKAFATVMRLEGAISTDKNDPGNTNKDGSAGFTVWGLSSRYNPGVTENMTIEDAREIYLEKYWIDAGCDGAQWPDDVVLFDTAVNQGISTIKTIMGAPGEWMGTWQDILFQRMLIYQKKSKDIYVKGHLFRVLRLYQMILDW